jgi:hypothetical protein
VSKTKGQISYSYSFWHLFADFVVVVVAAAAVGLVIVGRFDQVLVLAGIVANLLSNLCV